MRYTNDQFEAVVDGVVGDGGATLPDACVGRTIRYEHKGRKFPLRTTECRNKTRVVVRYDPGDDEIVSRGGGFATVCLMDDNVGLWPRYQANYRDA